MLRPIEHYTKCKSNHKIILQKTILINQLYLKSSFNVRYELVLSMQVQGNMFLILRKRDVKVPNSLTIILLAYDLDPKWNYIMK